MLITALYSDCLLLTLVGFKKR